MKGVVMSRNPASTQPLCTQLAKISRSGQSIEIQALIDSEAEKSFIDATLVTQMGIPTEPLNCLVEAKVLGWTIAQLHSPSSSRATTQRPSAST